MTVSNFEIARNRPDRRSAKIRYSGRNAKAGSNRRFEPSGGNLSTENPAPNTSASKFASSAEIDPGHVHRIDVIRVELSGIYLPQSREEIRLVERLAIAQCDLEEARRASEERLRWQKAHAGELYERGQLERFRADWKAWRNDSHSMRIVFGLTFHSATFLRDLWNRVEITVESTVGLTFEQIKNVILSQSGDWRVDRIDALRGRLMTWFLALQPDAARVIDRWVAESRAGRSDIGEIEEDLNRAQLFLAAAPPAEEAKRNLKELASKEYQAWTARADRQLEAFVKEQARYSEVTPPHPLGDASDVRETRRIQRALVAAENRFDKLERRLLALRKTRSRLNSKQCSDADSLRPCAIEPALDSKQFDVNRNEMIETQNEPAPRIEATVAHDAETESDAPQLLARRPNPKQLAKAWRSKHGHNSKARKPGGIDHESTVRQVETKAAWAHS